MNPSQTTQMSTTPTVQRTSKVVYTILEKPGREPFWMRIGWCNVNRDGSFNIHLDALPINGKLQVRDWHPREERTPSEGGDTPREPRFQ